MKYNVSLPGIVEGLEVTADRPMKAARIAIDQHKAKCVELALKGEAFAEVQGEQPKNGIRSRSYRVRCELRFNLDQHG